MNIVYLPTEQIKTAWLPNINPDDFERLVESIKEYGILEPLHVTRKETNGDDNDNREVTYRLVQGYQRYRAAENLGLDELPCVIVDDENTVLGAEFDVNLRRRHLTKEEVFEYEQDKEKVKEERQSTWKLIPELQFIQYTLPKDLVEMLTGWPQAKQREFYSRLPVKYVDDAEEATKKAEKSKKKVEEITDKIKQKDEEISELKKKIEEMEDEIEALNIIKNAKKKDFDNALEIEKKKMAEELQKEYSGNEFAIKLQEEKAKLEKEYNEKLQKEIAKETEAYRKIAANHSKERAELAKQLEPLREEIKQLQANL